MQWQPLSDIEIGKRFFDRRSALVAITKEGPFEPVSQVAE
jgi:hypothetical protein